MEYAEVARSESARGELVLRRRGGVDGTPSVLELRANGVFVMDTQETTAERALAEAALARAAHPERVLVGGLGLGFTLHAVLGADAVREVVVVEIEQALVDWMRTGTVPHGPQFLADRRVRIVVADVREALTEASSSSYDLVLLDVDNGPGYLVHATNAALYDRPALVEMRRVLRPGGVVAVWSADRAVSLDSSLREEFDLVDVVAVPVPRGGRDQRYWLYLAGVASAR